MRTTKWNWLSEPLKTLIWIFIALFIVIFVIGFFEINGFIPSSEVFGFLTGLLAGIFGILIGFSLNRVSEVGKDNQTKDDFLNLIREELTDIKNKISPQNKEVYILYTDIWDSMISTGFIRLLTAKQVTELSKVYKSIKEASYEAECNRQYSEQVENLILSNLLQRKAVENTLTINESNYKKRLENISTMIDKVLNEE